MKDQEFNPTIEIVITIRNLAIAVSGNWTTMKSVGETLESDLNSVSNYVNSYGTEDTKLKWKAIMDEYNSELNILKDIMATSINKIKRKDAENIADHWEKHVPHAERLEELYAEFEKIGAPTVPENKTNQWKSLWQNIYTSHDSIKKEAEAAGIQLRLIQENKPEEVDELTNTILKHIPMNFSREEAHQYTDEYMQAYEELKKEASQKKNIWDRFLDILAGGTQQTPAQKVMMQRWVNGEKNDSY